MKKTTLVRIVVVDDHEMLREGLRARLANAAGYEIVGEAGRASETYPMLEQARPDLVVLDLGLPDSRGLEVAAKIRADWPRIKILVLTGSDNESAAREALQAGVNGFIRKEDAALELLKAIPVVMAGQSYLSPSAVTAVSRALQPGSHPVAALPTGREREVLSALAEGLTYKEIASRLKIAARTVTTYRERLAQKTGCKTRAELVRYAVRHGIARA